MAETANIGSGGRLVDYFVVIGYDDTQERSDVSVGQVLQRFPVVDWLDVKFFQGLPLFCQPQGWRISTKPQPPTFFIGVLTDIGAERHYIACLSFSEAKLTSENPTLNDDDDLMDGASTLFVSNVNNVDLDESSSPALFQDASITISNNIGKSSQLHGSTLPLVYYPKCLVLVSRHAYFETFRNCLTTIYAVYMDKLPFELESLVGNLVSGVQVNPPGGPIVRFSLGAGDRQAFQPPASSTIPVTNSTVATLFQELGIYNVVCLFSATLTDKKILFHSQSYSRLMDACHALSSLIYPLKYSYTYIPILPASLIEALQSPTPFIMGLHIGFKSQLVDVMDVICVDVDSGSVFIPDTITVPPLPEPYQSRLQTWLTLVLNKDLYTADYAFVANSNSTANKLFSSSAQLPLIDKQIRACFLRLFADLFADYRLCLKIVRICPKPFLTFHKAAYLGMRCLQDDEFMNRLVESMLFLSFVSERGVPYRACDLFDEVYANMPKLLQDEGDDREKMFDNLQQLAQQLFANETSNQPITNKVPTPSDWTSTTSNSSIATRITAPFHTLDANRVQAVIDANLVKLYQDQPSTNPTNGNLSNLMSPLHRSLYLREVPAPKFAKYFLKGTQMNGNVRRLDVLKSCLKYIFENKISDARKMLSAVLLSMKSNVVRVAFCQELCSYLHPQNRAEMEAQQFDLLVRLMNCALQNNSAADEYGIAYALLSLATAYCRRLSTGVFQFAYTCIQDHPVWQNQQFWESAFYHDVHMQLRDLYLQQGTKKSSMSFGTALSRDAWNLNEEPCALKIAADKLRSISNLAASEIEDFAKQEEGIIFSQAIHYANRIVYFRVPMDANKLRKVNIRDLEESSCVSSKISNVSSASREGDSTTESDAESGYADGGVDVTGGTSDLGQAIVRWLSKFLDKIGAEAEISNEKMRQLYQMVPGVVAMHIEYIETVHRESKKLPPIHKPRMLVPAFLPNEQMLQGYLRVYLLPDGRLELPKSAEKAQDNYLLPAEGAIFMTNYRLIFKGQPCDPYVCEQVVMRVIPVMSITKHKRIGQQCFVGPDQTTHHFHDALQIRSATFQMMQIAFDEEVGQDKVQTFCQTLDQLRWPENLFDIFALSSTSSVSSAVANTLAQQKKHGTLKGFAKKTFTKTVQKAGFGKLSKTTSIAKAEYAFSISHGRNSASPFPIVAGTKNSTGSTTLPSPVRRGTVGGNLGSDSEDEKTPNSEKQDARTQFSRTLDRLAERAYCKDYQRLRLCTKAEVTLHSGNPPLTVSSRADEGHFRLSTVNRTYSVCRTYPAVIVVPSKLSDDSIKKIAKGHKHSRFPVVTWCSDKGALLLRGAGFQSRSWNRFKQQTYGHGASSGGTLSTSVGLSPKHLPPTSNQTALKSSVEQERYFSAIAALSPGPPLSLSSAGKHGLDSSMGSLLSLDSMMLANMDSMSMCSSYSNTPDINRKPLILANSIMGGDGQFQKMVGIRSSGGKSMGSRFGLRPGHQSKGATLGGMSRTTASSSTNPRRISVISDAGQYRIGAAYNATGSRVLSRAQLYIFGERNQAKDIKLDSKCDFISVDFPEAHQAKESLKKFLRATAPSAFPASDSNHSFIKALGESRWLYTIRSLLHTAGAIANIIDVQNSSVCVCLEYGWDATAQLVSLAQLMLDPYYRTLDGFRTLVEKDWLSFGHRFSRRCNHTLESMSSGFAPIFLMFLDAVHQIHYQFPCAFEFNDFYLRFLAYHSSAAFFRTFLMDSEAERVESGLLQFDSKPRPRPEVSSYHGYYPDDPSNPTGTVNSSKLRNLPGRHGSVSTGSPCTSIWDYISENHQRSTRFYNFLYTPEKYGVLRPVCALAALNVWDFYTDDPLSFGSPYDLEAAEAELQERQVDLPDAFSKDHGGDGRRTPLASRKIINLNYDSVDFSQHSGLDDALEEIRNRERELDVLPQRWDSILLKLRQRIEKDEKVSAQIGATMDWAKWLSRNLHKKATAELIMRGRLLSKGGSAAVGGGFGGGAQQRNSDRLSVLESGHNFQKYNPTAPEHCQVCNGLLWSVVKQGLRCSACEFSCHEKCAGLISTGCTGVQELSGKNASLEQVNNDCQGSGNYGRPRNASFVMDEFDSYVSAPAETRTYEGYLMKRGALLKAWKQRWFVLDSIKHELRYFDTKDDHLCRGRVELGEVMDIGPANAPAGTPKHLEGAFFDLKTSRRMYNFMATSPAEAHVWIEKIRACLN